MSTLRQILKTVLARYFVLFVVVCNLLFLKAIVAHLILRVFRFIQLKSSQVIGIICIYLNISIFF